MRQAAEICANSFRRNWYAFIAPTVSGLKEIYGKPTDTPTEIGTLVGLQRQAFQGLAWQAKEFGFSDDSGNRITPPINGNLFAHKVLQKTYKQIHEDPRREEGPKRTRILYKPRRTTE